MEIRENSSLELQEEKSAIDTSIKNKSVTDMTSGNIFWLLFKFSIPVILGAALQQAYNLSDTIIVGQALGDSALGSVAASTVLINVILSIMLGFGTGASVIVSQYFGAKQFHNLKRSVSTIMILLLIPTLIISIIGFFLSPTLLKMINVQPEYIKDGSNYLRIIFVGMTFTMFYNLIAGLLRGLGNSRIPLYFLAITTVLNVCLDLLLVKQYGIAGVAFATIFATFISCCLCIGYIKLKVPELNIKRNEWVFDSKLLGKVLKSSAPAAVQQFAITISILILQVIVSQYDRGTGLSIHLSAYGVGSKICDFVSLPTTCIGPGITAFAAQNKGKNLIQRIEKSYKYAILLMICFISLTTIPGMIFMNQLVRIVLNEKGNANFAAELKVARDFMWAMMPFYFFLGLQFTTNSLMRGAGDFLWPFIIMVTSMVIRTTFAFLFNRIFDSYIFAFYAFPLSWFISGVWAFLRFKSGKWKTKQLIKSETELALD